MGKIKDLRAKVKDGTATDDEKAELEELEAEAAETVDGDNKDDENDEDKLNKSVDKFISLVESKMATKKAAAPVVETTEVTKESFKQLGKDEKIKQFVMALVANDRQALKVMSEGSNGDGGFLVPTEWYTQIVEEIRDVAQIRSRATVIPNAPRQLNINSIVGTPKAKFRAESALKDTSTVTFGQISLTPYSLAVIVVLTKELIEDAQVAEGIIPLVTRKMAQSISEREERAFAAGSGTAEPTGIDNYNTSVKSVASVGNVVTSDAFIRALYRLGQSYRANAVWLMNSLTLSKVMQLKDTNGRYLFIADLTGATAGTLLGRTVIEQNDLPQSRVWLVDLRGYYIADSSGISVSQSEEATITGVGNLFEQNQVAIRVERRVDGELADPNGAVVITGTN